MNKPETTPLPFPTTSATAPGIGGHLASVVEAAEEALQPEHSSELGTDPAQPGERRHRSRRRVALGREQGIPLRLHRLELLQGQFQPVELAPDLCLQVRGQGPPIAGGQLLQSLAPVPAQRLVVGDALREQQPLDAVDVRDPLRHQRLALAAEPPTVLFFWAGWPDHGADPRLTTLVGQQRPEQGFAIDPVRLRLAPPARGQHGGGIDHVALNALPLQHAPQPEAIQASLMDGDDREGLARAGLRLCPQLCGVVQEPRHVAATN